MTPRGLALIATALLGVVLAVIPADATFSGSNGPIAFRYVDTDTGLGRPLFRVQQDGSQVTQLSSRPGFFSDWRADGGRVAFDFFERDGDEQIATMRPDGGDAMVITSGHGIHEAPSWSPSGRRIVFGYSPQADTNAPDFKTRLWTMRADGTQARRLPMASRGFDVEPRYSPDGETIAFMRLKIGEGDFFQAIFTVATEGGHRVQRLTPWRARSEHPTWSSDGSWIIYNDSPDGSVKVMRPDGSGRRAILPAREGFGAHKPWFSPDGTRVLFMCENQGTLKRPPADYNEDLCTANPDGSDMVNITNTPETFENWPSWGVVAP